MLHNVKMKKLFFITLILLFAVSTVNVYAQQPGWIQYFPPGGSSFTGGDLTSATTVYDGANFSIKNTTTPTKIMQFDLSGFTAGTRTFVFPNASDTVAVLGTQQIFTAVKEFSGSGQLFLGGAGAFATGNQFFYNTTLTPDAAFIGLSTTSLSLHISEYQDSGSDLQNGPCGTAACTNAQVIVHDKDVADITSYQSLGVTGLSGSFRKTLTESSATTVVQIPVASEAATGGVLNYCFYAADATDQQQRCSLVRFSAINKAGTETCGLSNNAGAADASITELEDGNASAISVGTFTYAITCLTGLANVVEIQANAVSSLTQTTLQARGTVILVGPGEPIP